MTAVSCELVGGPGCGTVFTLPRDPSSGEFAAPAREVFNVGLSADNKVVDPEGPNKHGKVVAVAVYERALARNARGLYEFKRIERVG